MIGQAFKKRPAFIGYLTVGDGGMQYCLECALALEKGGVDILELGIPFSDPVGEGPVIQSAMERSLKEGTTPDKVLEFIRTLRRHSQIPLVLMGYFNPFLNAGGAFLTEAKNAGADGILIVDLPLEEDHFFTHDLDQIRLITPSTSPERMEGICSASKGFVYYVAQKGTTGMRKGLVEHFAESIEKIKQCTQLPVAAGFGISSRETAQEVLKAADGFIVGSLFVDAMGRKEPPEKLEALARSIDPRIL